MATRQNEPASIPRGALVRLLEKLGVNNFQAAASISIADHVANRSVALLSRDGGGLFVGSGVCVQLGDHYLVATAKHNLQDRYSGREFEISEIEVCSRGEKFSEPLKVRRMGRSPNLDLGWLEIDPEASSRPALAFAGLDEFASLQENHGQHPCVLLGYPSALAESQTTPLLRPLLQSACVGTMSISPSNRRSLDCPDTFAIEWPPHDGSLDDGLPEPYGVSGGGIWALPGPDDYLVWSSERTKLVGIETLWRKEDKELIVVRIERWLRLVADQISELSDEIDSSLLKRLSEH